MLCFNWGVGDLWNIACAAGVPLDAVTSIMAPYGEGDMYEHDFRGVGHLSTHVECFGPGRRFVFRSQPKVLAVCPKSNGFRFRLFGVARVFTITCPERWDAATVASHFGNGDTGSDNSEGEQSGGGPQRKAARGVMRSDDSEDGEAVRDSIAEDVAEACL